tara:strand:+ start:95 stop:373 length:279 start_codon:yes stop_codon:yes gene_type:complete
MKLKDLINEKVLDDLKKNDKSQYKDIQSNYNKYQKMLKDVRRTQRDLRVSLIGASEFGSSESRKIEGHLSNVAKAMSNLDHALAKMKLDLGI